MGSRLSDYTAEQTAKTPLCSPASGNKGWEGTSPCPSGAQALSQLQTLGFCLRGLKRRDGFRGGLPLHFYVLQEPVDLSLLAYSDCIRVSWMCFGAGDISLVQRQGIYGFKCQSEGLFQF